jgi:hypothetical protein
VITIEGTAMFEMMLEAFYVNGTPLEKKVVILLNTSVLDFRGPYAPGVHFWSGGEMHNRQPLCRFSFNPNEREYLAVRKQPKKVELWSLKRGESLLVVDRRSGLRFLYIPPEQSAPPQLHLVSKQEVTDYLHEVARHSEKATNWVRLNLQALVSIL